MFVLFNLACSSPHTCTIFIHGQAAELALYAGKTAKEAEGILLGARPPLTHRAIDLNVRLFQWQRALELALDAGDEHVNVVLFHRRRYVDGRGDRESDEAFSQYAQDDERVVLDDDGVAALNKQWVDEEARAHGGGERRQSPQRSAVRREDEGDDRYSK